MLGGVPQVPQSLDELQQYLKTEIVALTPTFYSRRVAEHPSLQDSAFAAASDGSYVAKQMIALVHHYTPAGDRSKELTGQRMIAFTADVWTALGNEAPTSNLHYALKYNRIQKPIRSLIYGTTTQESTCPDLIVSIDRLLLFIGEETPARFGRHRAQRDITTNMQKGLQDIPYMPLYIAAGDEIQFGFVRADGKVMMSQQVFNLTFVRDRVQFLAASVAIYRLFAALLALAPNEDSRAAFYLPLARSNSTYITQTFSNDVSAGSMRAYEVANSSEHMVHANKAPQLQARLNPEFEEEMLAYFVQLTTLGSRKDIYWWTLPDLRAATHAVIQAAALLHSNGLVHCDLRAANILWDNGKPFSTDLEQVHEAGFEAKDLRFVSWTEKTKDENGCYTELSDMEQIGVLMHEWEKETEERLVGPARSLMEGLRIKSLSSHDAALHPWFNVSTQ